MASYLAAVLGPSQLAHPSRHKEVSTNSNHPSQDSTLNRVRLETGSQACDTGHQSVPTQLCLFLSSKRPAGSHACVTHALQVAQFRARDSAFDKDQASTTRIAQVLRHVFASPCLFGLVGFNRSLG